MSENEKCPVCNSDGVLMQTEFYNQFYVVCSRLFDCGWRRQEAFNTEKEAWQSWDYRPENDIESGTTSYLQTRCGIQKISIKKLRTEMERLKDIINRTHDEACNIFCDSGINSGKLMEILEEEVK